MAESASKIGDPVEMLKGYPAAVLALLAGRIAILVAASIAGTAILVLILGDDFSGQPIFGFIVAVVFLLLVATGVIHTAGKVKEAREFHAGYTTIMRAHVNVNQVDASSCRVVRIAGEQFLTRDQYNLRIAIIRDGDPGRPSGG